MRDCVAHGDSAVGVVEGAVRDATEVETNQEGGSSDLVKIVTGEETRFRRKTDRCAISEVRRSILNAQRKRKRSGIGRPCLWLFAHLMRRYGVGTRRASSSSRP